MKSIYEDYCLAATLRRYAEQGVDDTNWWQPFRRRPAFMKLRELQENDRLSDLAMSVADELLMREFVRARQREHPQRNAFRPDCLQQLGQVAEAAAKAALGLEATNGCRHAFVGQP